jgi:hypothetical protein
VAPRAQARVLLMGAWARGRVGAVSSTRGGSHRAMAESETNICSAPIEQVFSALQNVCSQTRVQPRTRVLGTHVSTLEHMFCNMCSHPRNMCTSRTYVRVERAFDREPNSKTRTRAEFPNSNAGRIRTRAEFKDSTESRIRRLDREPNRQSRPRAESRLPTARRIDRTEPKPNSALACASSQRSARL